MRSPLVLASSALLLAACVAEKRAPTPEQPRAAAPVPALPAGPVGEDWRDVPLTPGMWFYRTDGAAGSVAQFGPPGGIALFAMRCDLAARRIVFSRGGGGAEAAALRAIGFLTSFASFAVPAAPAAGQPPAVTATVAAADPNLDRLAFSRGRFVVTLTGAPRLVIPAWPEVGRVIEDCRG